MLDAGESLQSMIAFLAGRNPVSLKSDPVFATERANLQKKMAKVVGTSKARFEEPWGLVSLYWATGSQGASARLVTSAVTLALPTGGVKG